MHTKFWLRNMKERDHSDLGVDERITEWILEEKGQKLWTGLIWLMMGPVAGCCEYGNEPSGSIKGRELLVYLSDY